MCNVVVFQLVLARLGKRLDQDGVVLRRNKCNCIYTELRSHHSLISIRCTVMVKAVLVLAFDWVDEDASI